MATFKALYGIRCCSLVGWFEAGETQLTRPELIQDALKKVRIIQM